ncbi:PREDICTED: probable polygalacturonase At3g15720 [Fragaria vesca subsp. vesca]|uniref:probable polygalacturonase At3g15720 n=1 Tax=Fragaria vesca subsp. vesca TaxID=101020 RepID=UPI0002C33E18|nr:PREDICTED: probable polygalacturonase At3g15720 [Fragaria vesca subsp. vesca]
MRNALVLLILHTIASSNFSFGHGQTTFNVLDYGAAGDGERDDSKAFLEAWNASCSTYASEGTTTLVIPAEKTFLLQPTTFSGSCNSGNGIRVEIMGKIVAPKNPDEWKECVESWLSFGNLSNLIINGTGEINGQGSPWWSNITTQVNALHFFNCSNLRLSGVTHVDSPKAHISINRSNNVTVSDIHILAPHDSPNTDGIDISVSTYVNIHDSKIATGDDCIAINNGSSFINITNIACGPGHGISVGSLGVNRSYQTAEQINVRNCSFNGTQNGARLKTWQGGSGYARKITFENITLTDAKHPIIIDQHYCNGKHDCPNSTQAVQVSDVTYSNIQGTSSSMEAIVFNCTQIPGCTNIVMKQINITSAIAYQNISASCINANGTCSTTVPQVSCLKTNETMSFNLYT